MNKKENTKNIASLLPEAIVSAMSEESLSVLKEEFDRLVESKVAERINVATAAAEAALDEEVNKKCTALVMKIEEAHKIGLEKVYTHLTEKHEKQLNNVREYYKNQLGREALKFKNQLVESVSRFIDQRVDSLIPYEDVKKAVKNDTAMKLLESFKSMLAVNSAATDKNIRGAILEGHNMLKAAQSKADALQNENVKLQQQIDEMADSYAFERNISQLDEDTKNFVIRLAKKGGVGYVNENFGYVCNLYEKKLEQDRKALAAKEFDSKNRNKLQNVNRRMLAEKTSPKRSTMINENADVDSLIDMIDFDNRD